MFYKIALRNAKRNINQYLIYFMTLIMAAASFYVVLSIEAQDVMRFLKTFESDAVGKLLIYIQIIFFACLILMFFLIMFANKFLIRRRKKEMGVYLMMGLTRGKILLMLVLEGIITSLAALIAGLIIGIVLSDFISLISAKIFTVDIIGHKFIISTTAILETSLGFMVIELISITLESFSIYKSQVHSLLYDDTKKKKLKERSPKIAALVLVTGIASLLTAYGLIISFGFLEIDFKYLLISVVLGFYGTMAVVYGTTALTGTKEHRNRSRYFKGLNAFTSRQIHGQVAGRFQSLGFISLLLFLSITMLSYGCSMAMTSEAKMEYKYNVFDFTLADFMNDPALIEDCLSSPEVAPYVDSLAEMEVGNYDNDSHDIVMGTYADKYWSEYLISESSYNEVLKAAGQPTLDLKEGEAALYNDVGSGYNSNKGAGPITIDGKPFTVVGDVYNYDLVTDRFITIYTGLILRDEDFNKYVSPSNINVFYNFKLPDTAVKSRGKIAVTEELMTILDKTGLAYETSLQGFARQLFMTISTSYTLVYMGIIFMMVTGTLLALQFITELRDNKIRYQTLTDLGATQDQMRKSVYSQIKLYFLIPLVPALSSSTAGVIGLTRVVAVRGFDTISIVITTLVAVVLLLLVYGVYFLAVRKSGKDLIGSLERRII